MTDIRVDFPADALPAAIAVLDGLKAAGVWLGPSDSPTNMLGEHLGETALRGALGIAAATYTGPDGATVNVAARGDPTRLYICIRTEMSEADIVAHLPPGTTLADMLAAAGLALSDPEVSRAVIGVWS